MQNSDLGMLFLLNERRLDFYGECKRLEDLHESRKQARKDFRFWLGTMLITAGLRLKGEEK